MINLLGVHLTLLIGPTVPVPAPPELMEALEQVTVTHADSSMSGFQMTFKVGRSSALDLIDYGILRNPLLLKPFNRIVLMVTFGVVPQVLIDGFITHQQLSPGAAPGSSTLTVTGEDASVMLDLKEIPAEHPAQDETIIANKIILSYAQYGLIPRVIPPLVIDPPVPTDRIPSQQTTDYAYLQEMAGRFGYVFFITPGLVPLTNTAYWGPPPRLSVPQKALSVNLGAETNVDQISFTTDSQATTMYDGQVQDRLTNQKVPVKTLVSTRVPLSAEPAWLVQQPNVRRRQMSMSGLNVAQAYARAQGETDATVDGTVSASGELNALTYGALLQPRGLVGLRGAGYRHDGIYYVKSVTHTVKVGEYKQQFSLNRDGWGISDSGGADMSGRTKFYGKYRGKVENNLDPQQQGRLQVSCAAVFGDGSLAWAMPCAPFAGPGVGFFALPPRGANLWVEFEGGDPDYPIWSGCFWGLGEAPALPAVEQVHVIKTASLTLTLSDLPGVGGFTLEVNPPAVATPLKMVFNASGIELSNGAASVKLTPASVSINNGALEVI